MKILLTNDDGIYTDGIIDLAKALNDLGHKITIIAPDSQQSGTGHSLTFHDYIEYKKHNIIENIEAYSITGTPCDCIKFATLVVLDEKPDFVISGINNVMNVGHDLYYSGTSNAAIEAALNDIKAIAVSLEARDNYYEDTIEFLVNNLKTLYNLIPSSKTILNINFPHSHKEDIKGVKFTSVGEKYYNDRYRIIDGKYYLEGNYKYFENNDENCDVEVTEKGYISISPVKVEFTDLAYLDEMMKKKVIWK